jgi:alkylated DNA nucleotide flippase Atl1
MSRMAHGVPMRERVSAVAEQIPPGSWTTYGDMAAMIGSHARSVATCLGTWPIPNAHRILTVAGKVSEGFAWRDGRTDDPVELLRAEGIRFAHGRADPRQRCIRRGLNGRAIISTGRRARMTPTRTSFSLIRTRLDELCD